MVDDSLWDVTMKRAVETGNVDPVDGRKFKIDSSGHDLPSLSVGHDPIVDGRSIRIVLAGLHAMDEAMATLQRPGRIAPPNDLLHRFHNKFCYEILFGFFGVVPWSSR